MTNESAETLTPVSILVQTGFFRDLTAHQLERVAELSEMQHCDEGQQVYRVGEPAYSVYVLVRGMVRLAVGYGERNASAGNVLRRGEVFGWAALTPSCNLRIATATCLTPCSFLAIDGAGLLGLMEQDHTLGYRLMTQLNQIITGTLTAFAGG
ncbi:cyclic nucleotide-binding domain-containing protein [Methylibium sp.]|uniref:cyclic nucleotide-binding domain-containing protein n=1 Tax=Methylibium sp. TaxID=2067992 RepID=UPI003D09F195